MANVSSDDKKQQDLALSRLGWSLRRIEQATGVRRETASNYLKAAGVEVRPPGTWGRQAVSKPAIEVTTDFGWQNRPRRWPPTPSVRLVVRPPAPANPFAS